MRFYKRHTVLSNCAMADSFAYRMHRALPVHRSHNRSSPSQLPEMMSVSLTRLRAMHATASLWPLRARTNGLAKTLSSLTAFSARVYSRARSNGCRTGSGFRNVLTMSLFRSRVKSSSTLFITLIFIFTCQLTSESGC